MKTKSTSLRHVTHLAIQGLRLQSRELGFPILTAGLFCLLVLVGAMALSVYKGIPAAAMTRDPL